MEGLYSPPPSSTGCHGSKSMADPVWVSSGVRSPVGSAPPSTPYPQPFSHPKAILFQPTPRPELTAGMGSAKCVYTTASRGEGQSALTHHHTSPCSYLLPTPTPLQPPQPSLHAWDPFGLPVPLPQPWGVWARPCCPTPGSPPPAPHPAAVPTGPWGWLLAYGCWSSSPSTSTSPQPASSTSGEGSGAVGCCCHSPGHAQPPWVGGREGLGCGRDGEGVCAARSHTVSPSPAASWAPRSPSASGRTPRTSRWRMCPARLVSWAGVPLVLLLSSPCLVTGCPFPGTGKRGLPSHIPVPLAELGAGVEWAAVGTIPWLCLWGGSLGWWGSTPLTISSPFTERVKAELEAELGLKIVQTGVGEVGARHGRPSGLGWLGTGRWGCCCRQRAGKRAVPQPWGIGVS